MRTISRGMDIMILITMNPKINQLPSHFVTNGGFDSTDTMIGENNRQTKIHALSYIFHARDAFLWYENLGITNLLLFIYLFL